MPHWDCPEKGLGACLNPNDCICENIHQYHCFETYFTGCGCDKRGSDDCDKDGNCICKINFKGEKCHQCQDNYFRFPFCQACNCDANGSIDQQCNENGTCLCKDNVQGPKCLKCEPEFYGHPDCKACDCKSGSVDNLCDSNGVCRCGENFSGNKCDSCQVGYFNYPSCTSMLLNWLVGPTTAGPASGNRVPGEDSRGLKDLEDLDIVWFLLGCSHYDRQSRIDWGIMAF